MDSIEIVSDTEVKIAGKIYKFRHPDLWTVEEVGQIEDAATKVSPIGRASIDSTELKSRALAKAVEGLTEAEARKLPYHVGEPLFQIVRWQPVPLGNSLSSNFGSGAAESKSEK